MKNVSLFFISITTFYYTQTLPMIKTLGHSFAVRDARRGCWDSAQQRMHAVVTQYSDDPEVMYDAGVVAYSNKQFEQAQAYFDAAEKNSSEKKSIREQALFNLGNSAVALKRYEQALDAYEKLLTMNPDNRYAQHNRDKVRELLEQQKQNKKDEQDQNKNDDKENKEKDGQQNEPEKNSSSKDDQNQSDKKDQQNQSDSGNDDHKEKQSSKNKSDQSDSKDQPKEGQKNQKPKERNESENGAGQGKNQKNGDNKDTSEQDQNNDPRDQKQPDKNDDDGQDNQQKGEESRNQSSEEKSEKNDAADKSEQKGDAERAVGTHEEKSQDSLEKQNERAIAAAQGADKELFGEKEQWMGRLLKQQEEADKNAQRLMIKAAANKAQGAGNDQYSW